MAPEVERILQRSLDLIEENLCSDLSIRDLSEEAGFSLFHFYRLFEAATGMSVKRYMTRRKLLHAAYEISCGMEKTAAALRYGFETYSGFYRAFRRETGMSPKDFLQSHCISRPSRVSLKEEHAAMEEKQIRKALAAWDMADEPVCSVYYHNTGNRSENTVQVGGRYVLKWSSSLGELHRQGRLQKLLASHALAAPLIPSCEGEDVVQTEDCDFLLMEKIQAEPVDAARIMHSPHEARAIGEALARLHQVLITCDPLLCREENLLSTLKDWAIPAASKEKGIRLPHLEHLMNAYDALPKQIVHRDPNPDNLLMRDGKVVCFLDFQLSRILPRIFDLAYAATGILSHTFGKVETRDDFFDVAHELWRGYHQLSPLTVPEQEVLPEMVLAVQLICVAAFSGSTKYASLARTNREMLEMLMEHEQKLRNVPW